MYVTTAGAITRAHIDGNSTVDACHHCISGTNEIVMLPSLDPTRTAEAMSILFKGADGGMSGEELVYLHPHGPNKKATIKWPTIATIDRLKAKG